MDTATRASVMTRNDEQGGVSVRLVRLERHESRVADDVRAVLAATVSLATAHRPRSVDQVRALIRGLAPEAPEFSDEVLLGEGFSRFTDDSPPESLWDTSPPAPRRPATGAASSAANPAPAGP